MLERAAISYAHWQLKRDPDGVAHLGEISAELDDLEQAIRQCILTPKRSVPLNPEKGCDLAPYRDRPMNVRHIFIGAEIREAIERDEPRVEVGEIEVSADDFHEISIKLTWRPVAWVQSEFISSEVSYVF